MIPECYVPKKHIREIRDVIRHKIRLVQDRTRTINRVHSLLDKYGKKADAYKMHSLKAIQWMQSNVLDSVRDDMILKQHAKHIQCLNEEIFKLDCFIEKEALESEYAKLLVSITGMGSYMALLLAAEIGDISRFKGPKNLVSWAGMCPTIHQSGEKIHMGRIKKSTQTDW